MSQRILGVGPKKSGEKMLKDAIGQFKGIISQIQAGATKVKVKLTANAKKVTKIQNENIRLETVMSEALLAAGNLEAILSKKVLTEEVPAEDDTVESDKTVEADKTAEADEEEDEPPEDTTSKESDS